MKKRQLKKSVRIYGEGPTERMYFNWLRTHGNFKVRLAPAIPVHSDYSTMLAYADEDVRSEEYDYAICIMDLDKII